MAAWQRWLEAHRDEFTALTIRDHMTTSFHLDRGDLELAPFDCQSGLGTMYQLFVDRVDAIMDERNEALVA